MMNRFLRSLLPVLFIGFISSCSNDKVAVQKDDYISILAELAILNSMSEAYLEEERYHERREEILTHYGITEEEFNRSHEFYQQQIPQQLDRLRQINILLRQERDSIQQAERDFRRANREPADSLRQRILNSDTTGN